MNEVKVTVVLPVYNIENYIKRNLESLVNQTLKEVEILCINDGSTDNTLNIVKEYAKKCKNITVIDKENEGAWKSRLFGLRKARGKYTIVLDSDDYVHPEFLEKLYNKAEETNADITVCGYQRMSEETNHVYSKEMVNWEDKVVDMGKNPEDTISINTSLWNKLIKTEIIKDMPDLSKKPLICEDVMFLLFAYLITKKIVFINDILYYYMIHQNSIITTVKKEKIETSKELMLEIKQVYENHENGKKLKEVLSAITFLHFGVSLMTRVIINKETTLSKEIKANREYLNKEFSEWRTTKYLNIIYCLKHHSNVKVAIAKKIYTMHLLLPFIKVYNFMIEHLKIDIKW